MKTPEQIADMIWGHHGLDHEETMFDHMTWEDFVAWIKEEKPQPNEEELNKAFEAIEQADIKIPTRVDANGDIWVGIIDGLK